MQPSFNSDNENWSEINTLIGNIATAANLTAGEQAELVRIDARSQWRPRDVNSFLHLLGETMRRKTGASD